MNSSLRDTFDSMCNDSLLFMHIDNRTVPPHLQPRITEDASGLVVFEFPLLEELGGTPLDTTYVLGTTHVADSEPHRDRIPRNSLNCHLTIQGSMLGKGAIIDDELHDDGGGLVVPMDEAFIDAPIQTITAGPGDIYLFFGGRVTHDMTSGPDGRISAMRHYIFDL